MVLVVAVEWVVILLQGLAQEANLMEELQYQSVVLILIQLEVAELLLMEETLQQVLVEMDLLQVLLDHL